MLIHPFSITHEDTIMPKKIRKLFRKSQRPSARASNNSHVWHSPLNNLCKMILFYQMEVLKKYTKVSLPFNQSVSNIVEQIACFATQNLLYVCVWILLEAIQVLRDASRDSLILHCWSGFGAHLGRDLILICLLALNASV